jgi:hypothetical protein
MSVSSEEDDNRIFIGEVIDEEASKLTITTYNGDKIKLRAINPLLPARTNIAYYKDADEDVDIPSEHWNKWFTEWPKLKLLYSEVVQEYAKLGLPLIITVNTDEKTTGNDGQLGADFTSIYNDYIIGAGFDDFDIFDYPSLHAFFFTRSEEEKYTPEAAIYIRLEGIKSGTESELKEFITCLLETSFGKNCIQCNPTKLFDWKIKLDC